MPDYGAKMADKAIADIESKLRSSYGTAQRELRKKLRDFNARFAAKDREKRKLLDDGKITKQEYADWKAGQVFQRGQWEEKVREVSRVMSQTNEQAARIINDGRLDVFSENYNFMAFHGEKQTGVSFNIYNTQAVARLIQDDPKVLPEWKIDEEKDYTWNYQKVNNIVQQGIIQGESIEGMTKRLCTDLATQNENRMRMFARTAITGAQNAGRQAQMEDAAAMGLEVHKQWLAIMDAHTRSLHKERDGEEVPYNEDFSGGLEYPGDPAGDPEDVYNCRCTMISVYPEHAAHHEGGPRIAYGEEDEDGYRESYLTTEDSKEYKEWKAKKEKEGNIVGARHDGSVGKYKPDKYDAEYENLEKRIAEERAKESSERERLDNEQIAAYRESEKYRNLMRYLSQDVSEYDKIKTEEEYDKYHQELVEKVGDLHEKLDALRQNIPIRLDFKSDAEFERAYEEYLMRKREIRSQLDKYEPLLYNEASWKFIERAREAQLLGAEEIKRRQEAAIARYEAIAEEKRHISDLYYKLIGEKSKYGIEMAAKIAERDGVEWLTVKRSSEPFDSAKVIKKLAGPDKTTGSCASLAFAYVGQKGGYDVIDYRGGKSRELFSHQCVNILKSMKENGLPVSVGTARSYTTAGKRALKNVQEGKEYYFECGSHAAIVRKINGDLQYLEMQSGYRENTWYSFSDYGEEKTLRWRFGSGDSLGFDVESYLVDADAMANDERFLKILGYINTDPAKQQKGAGGHER